jgi:hypothetical protein
MEANSYMKGLLDRPEGPNQGANKICNLKQSTSKQSIDKYDEQANKSQSVVCCGTFNMMILKDAGSL